MKHRCTRCTKVKPVAFEYEVITKTHGARELILCEHCLKWGLLRILSSPDGARLFEVLYSHAKECASYITSKKEDQVLLEVSEQLDQKTIISPNPNAIK